MVRQIVRRSSVDVDFEIVGMAGNGDETRNDQMIVQADIQRVRLQQSRVERQLEYEVPLQVLDGLGTLFNDLAKLFQLCTVYRAGRHEFAVG